MSAIDGMSVLVSGAGIAGPAVASWLDRYGADVTVVERAPGLRPGGQAVDLRGVGRTVVERMGLLDATRELGLRQQGIEWVDARGRVTVRFPVDAFGGEGLVSEIEILRGDLAELLYDATVPRVDYLFDDTITALHVDDDGVDVQFESAPGRRFDLVVGADGLHSTVRRLAFCPEREAVSPLGCHIAWFTASGGPDLAGWYQIHNAPRGRVASARPGHAGSDPRAALSFRSDPLPERLDRGAQRAILAARFADLPDRYQWLVDASQTAPDLSFESLGQVHLPSWTKDRVALVGDAAYCPSPLAGLGTSLALVGAHVLAGEIASADGDLVGAFARYNSLMRPYVAQCQQLPPGGVRSYAPMSAAGIRLQAMSMRSMTRWPLRAVMERQAAKADALHLPPYADLAGRARDAG